MLNYVALELWSYGENVDGFGMRTNAFFTTDPTDDIQGLCRAGRKNGIKWGRSDLRGAFNQECESIHKIRMN